MSKQVTFHIENAKALRFAANQTSVGGARRMFYMMAINEIRRARMIKAYGN